ncbi:MAG: Chemotaxis protein [Rhizobium sp.]|nr:Chemotaxis protein [Rhizobium sp.]
MIPAAATTPSDDSSLTFRLGGEIHTIAADMVMEVIRRPAITRVPHGPAALAGIANLRGVAMPVISVARLLGQSGTDALVEEKIIVYQHQGLIGLLVDDIISFGSADGSARRLTDLGEKLDKAFKPSQSSHAPKLTRGGDSAEDNVRSDSHLISLLSFRLAGQLFAFPIGSVHEVLSMPSELAVVPNADATIMGVLNLRDSVVPVISLARLLGLELATTSERLVVVEFEGSLVGLAVEALDAIRRLPETAIDAVPDILKRGDGPAEIESIGRSDNGRTLVSILSVEKLFGNAVVRQAVDGTSGAISMSSSDTQSVEQEQFLIFELGDETYGLPIKAVDEVVRVPDTITRMPNAPAFVTGVMNLRGKPIPLIDQRLRFDTPQSAASERKPRAIIVTIGHLQAGFIVDGASEVANVPLSGLLEAPNFSAERTEIFDRIAHIEADGRMILLIDPKALLTRAERDIVAALADGASMKSSK